MSTPPSLQPNTPHAARPCAACGAPLSAEATFCATCGEIVRPAYTGPTMRLEQSELARRYPTPASATAGLTGRIDDATLALILDELQRTGDRDAAIRDVAQLYGCHWDAAELLVARIEQRYAGNIGRAFWRPTVFVLVAAVVVLAMAAVIWLRITAAMP